MTAATLQREIKVLKERQARLEKMVNHLLSTPIFDLPYGDWPLRTSTKRRVERARRDIAAGKGIRLESAQALRKYFREMRHE